MTDKPPASSRRSFRRTVTISVSLAMGGMSAFLFSVKEVNPAVVIEWNRQAALVTVISVALTWKFCSALISENGSDASRRKWIKIYSAFCLFCLFASVAQGLRTVSPERLEAMGVGFAFAVIALAGLGFLVRKIVRFLEHDHAETMKERNEE